MDIKEFMSQANRKIEEVLVEKLSLIGYYPEDVLSDDPSRRPEIIRITSQQGTTVVHEYSVNGIDLFGVIWGFQSVTIIESDKDETEMRKNNKQ